MKVNLFRVILPVEDIGIATEFYAAVLGDPGKRVSDGRHYFGDGKTGAILACYDPRADGDQIGGGWYHHPLQYLYFSVENLEASRNACKEAGASEITSIDSMPWGETMFYALDPFGNPISFVQAGTEFTS